MLRLDGTLTPESGAVPRRSLPLALHESMDWIRRSAKPWKRAPRARGSPFAPPSLNVTTLPSGVAFAAAVVTSGASSPIVRRGDRDDGSTGQAMASVARSTAIACLGSSLTAGAAYAASSIPRGALADGRSLAARSAAYSALGGGSALALSAGWYGVLPPLVPTQGYPLRAHALRSAIFHTVVVPPVVAAAVWASVLIDRQPRAHLGRVYAQVLGSTWIWAAGCLSAYHVALEKCAPRVLVPAALVAGLLQWSMTFRAVSQDWSEVGLDERESRTAISRWRTLSPEQDKLPVAVAIRNGDTSVVDRGGRRA